MIKRRVVGKKKTGVRRAMRGSRKGVPKGDKRERTRAALLAAARELVREKGYEHTTLQDVAERAGMTSGAIYGNFRNRDDLFMAMSETFWGPVKADLSAAASWAQMLDAMADAALAEMPERRLAAVGALTGRAYALNHEDIRRRGVEATQRAYAEGAAWLRSAVPEDALALPPDQVVRVLHVLMDGLMFQRCLTPELVPDALFRAALGLLVRRGPPRA